MERAPVLWGNLCPGFVSHPTSFLSLWPGSKDWKHTSQFMPMHTHMGWNIFCFMSSDKHPLWSCSSRPSPPHLLPTKGGLLEAAAAFSSPTAIWLKAPLNMTDFFLLLCQPWKPHRHKLSESRSTSSAAERREAWCWWENNHCLWHLQRGCSSKHMNKQQHEMLKPWKLMCLLMIMVLHLASCVCHQQFINAD